LDASLLNPMLLRRWRRILGASPTLEASKDNGDGARGGTLGITAFLKASSLKIHLQLVACPPCSRRHPWSLPCRSLLVEFLAMLVCAYVLLVMVCPVALDLAVVVWLSLRMLCHYRCLPRQMLGRHWIPWQILCRHCCWFPLWQMLCCQECRGGSPLGILCHNGRLRFFPDTCLVVGGTLADALPPLALWSSL
jgi:hypothetical protein